ncbi:MAG TPA: transglutaminase-like domain-containing protein, partial [Tepidisphaeraceae bacterium]|nr:transglutaminase-like domain-containing protein [Tepidisphaeraceae bacterium]
IESYGEPVRSDNQQKMIGLRPDDGRTAAASDRENLSVGRSFDLRRRPTDRATGTRDDVGAAARVFVKGPMPVYLPLATFQDFDEDVWIVADAPVDASPVRPDERPGWMPVLQRPISPSFAGTQQHEIRVGDLGGSILPAPPLVERFRMGRITRPEFFGSTRSGLLRLARRSLPAGATLVVESKIVSPQRLVNVEPALPRHSDPALLRSTADARVQALAREWAGDRERGWRQIEQVVARLRDHVTVVSDVAIPHESREPGMIIDDLLFGTRAGRDCDIASAAVMLLRSLGYPTRLVSGLYADADTIDPDSGFASLGARDVRFWIEIRLADGSWITVDPIPGFPMLNLPRSTGEWVTAVWDRTLVVLSARPLLLTLIVALPIGLFLLRRPIVDGFVTTRCRLRGHRPAEVLRVIETRARLTGKPRPPGAPVGAWIEHLDPKLRDNGFVSSLNRALYASGTTSDPSVGRSALKQLTRRTIRQRATEAP